MLFPSFIIITLVMHFIARFRENHLLNDFLAGVKPAAVGLIAAAAMTIASGVLLNPGASHDTLLTDPLSTLALLPVAAFVATAVANIRFRINPILLTALAGIAGAFLAR
jgi:chromate transporter